MRRTYITGYEGNNLCNYIVEVEEECPTCGGSKEVETEKCFRFSELEGFVCEHGVECEEDCQKFCGPFVTCPHCGGEGKLIHWE